MKGLKMVLTGLIIGFVVGMWFGINIGKGNPIVSNPFAKQDIPEKFKQRVGEKIEKLGENIKGTPKKPKE